MLYRLFIYGTKAATGNVISGCSMLSPVELSIESSGGCFTAIDGMGGYEGGEKAARLVALSFLENAEGWNIPMKEGKNKINLILKEAVRHISDTAASRPDLSSMGAALAGIALCADGVLVFNCGDCRVYRQQGQYLERLSHDHSVVQELCDRGEIEDLDSFLGRDDPDDADGMEIPSLIENEGDYE